MKQWKAKGAVTILAAVILIVAAVSLCASVYRKHALAAAAPGRGLVFDATELDWGTIRDPKVRTLAHQFRFRNESRKAVVINDIKTSCGCTIGKLDKRVYEPGEAGVVDASMTLKSMGQNRNQLIVNSTAGPKVLTLNAIYAPPSYVSVIPMAVEISTDDSAIIEVDIHVLSVVPRQVKIASASLANGRGLKLENGPVRRIEIPSSKGFYRTTFRLLLTVIGEPAAQDELRVEFREEGIGTVRVPVRLLATHPVPPQPRALAR